MAAFDQSKLLHVTAASEWRDWLRHHAAREREVWLVYNKKHTGKPRVAYNDAVEEALAVGWIDGTIRRLDDERYAQRFTPRRPGSNWSAPNIRRVRKLIAEGRLTAAGRRLLPASLELPGDGGAGATVDTYASAIDAATTDRWADWQAPGWVLAAIAAHPRAQAGYEALAPSLRRRYVGWITDAKRPETRERRLRDVLATLAGDDSPAPR